MLLLLCVLLLLFFAFDVIDLLYDCAAVGVGVDIWPMERTMAALLIMTTFLSFGYFHRCQMFGSPIHRESEMYLI